MKLKTIILTFIVAATCWGQADDCKPSRSIFRARLTLACYPDRRVTLRVAAPDAQKVQVRLGGAHDMTKGADGFWTVTIPPPGGRLPLLQHRGGWRRRRRSFHPDILRLGMGQQRHRDSRAGCRAATTPPKTYRTAR